MKRNCSMARDLMPLCIDGAAGEESQNFVAAHVAECAECRDTYREMQESLPGTEDGTAQAEMNKRVARQLQERRRRRIGRMVLLGLCICTLVALGMYAFFSTHTSVPMAHYTQTAYLRADGMHAVIVRSYQGECSGNGARLEPTEDGSIYYLELYQARFHAKEQEKVVELAAMDVPLADCKELRQGSPQQYKTLWRRGETMPNCSAEMEAYCTYLESMNRRILVQCEDGWNIYYGLSSSFVSADEQTPLILTEAEWSAVQAEAERLRQAVPELQVS